MTKFAAILAGCAALTLAGCMAGAPAERWQPYSSSAMAITGDVRFSPRRIIFQDGQSLALDFVRHGELATGEDGPREAEFYRVRRPRELRLIRRNLFCNPVTAYLAIIRNGGRPGTAIAGDRNDRRLYVYSDEPAAHPTPLCAVYNYDYLPDS